MKNKIKRLADKKIALLGLGIENQALLKYLFLQKINCEITICDFRSPELLGARFEEINKLAGKQRFIDLKWQLEGGYKEQLYKFDILFRSPGWILSCPKIKEAKKLNKTIEVSSPIKFFLEIVPTKNIIGVTGTKGKGTTSSLIYAILKEAKKKVWLGGNIGVAPFDFMAKLKATDWVVLELSSFHLEDVMISPRIAVVVNFYKEHLAPADPNNPNFHKTLAAYWLAKSNIFRFQKKSDLAVFHQSLKPRIKKEKPKSKVVYYDKLDLPSKLPGDHNKANIAAANEVAKFIGVKEKVIAKAVAKFPGLEHRIELVNQVQGVKFFDDSFATTPEAAIIALKAFSSPIILLAGGADKGANFKNFAKEIKRRVKYVVLLAGAATLRLGDELIRAGYSENKIFLADNITVAVTEAKKQAVAGDVILLSTGCASFGMFKNYKERGNLFKSEAKKIK
ncbi:MAG: UDP-N-acetylmuramoylalanine-D-glutamate ligase [Parcubacteria group bacterium GW2011_GWE2_39_37]|uniref:UDP-N-acetylmuramoylalanine--D-glutamate ligase n=1 Tax=Candidatus Falkowbacteria bacterium GW2011_GWF2_39_8 TaxID=1618642 RepID=A0A0G0Q603_9BACT|nr:MAG: UDP-N-acetylmuramoylalanine-D-glutamate ligase [Parcubacteria group bacterium GW2011_GWE2_39_37]KKR32766.1 MAG: UDP-N-acetylmuramoylalanine-D-glutamate ligase [Candidatus Falkowbacteria bacterium GW2011_GWF2_39_8]